MPKTATRPEKTNQKAGRGENAVRWFEIYVQDMERARKFYETVLQVKLEKLNTSEMDYWTFKMNPKQAGTGGALVKMKGVPSGGSTLVYFGCDDCAVEAGRVAKAGGKIDKPKMSIGEYGHIALAVDTEGNMFGLHSLK
jgi:predicted enzyme related to lactoylglutathione lyase